MSSTSRHRILWSYSSPTQLNLLPAGTVSSWSQLKEVVTKTLNLNLNPTAFSVATLDQGDAHPIPVQKYDVGLREGIILHLPAAEMSLEVHMKDGRSFRILTNPLHSIHDLKTQICQQKGYPVEQQELFFKNQALLNKSLLLDYNIKGNNKVHLQVQPGELFAIHVQTFWGRTFDVEIAPHYTAKDVLQKVFRREQLKKEIAEKSESLMLVKYSGRILDKELCMNFYSIKQGAQLQLVSISEVSKRLQQTINVCIAESEVNYSVTAADSDTWLVVALKLQALTGVSATNMTLVADTGQVDFGATISELNPTDLKKIHVVFRKQRKPEFSISNPKIKLELQLPSGVSHVLECSKKNTVREIKEMLVNYDVDNVQSYDIVQNKVVLADGSNLQNLKLQDKCKLALRVRDFQVTIYHGGNPFRVGAQPNQTLSSLLHKIKSPSGKFKVIHCGKELDVDHNKVLKDTSLCDGSHIFVETSSSQIKVLHLVVGNVVIPMSSNHSVNPLHNQQLKSLGVDTEYIHRSVQGFLNWRFRGQKPIISRQSTGLAQRRNSARRTLLSREQKQSSLIASESEIKPRSWQCLERIPPRWRDIITSTQAPSSSIIRDEADKKADLASPESTRLSLSRRHRSAIIRLPQLTDRSENMAYKEDATSNPISVRTPAIKSALSRKLPSASKKRNLSVHFQMPGEDLSSENTVKVWTLRGLQRTNSSKKPSTANSYRLSPLQYSSLKLNSPLEFTNERLYSRETSHLGWRDQSALSLTRETSHMQTRKTV